MEKQEDTRSQADGTPAAGRPHMIGYGLTEEQDGLLPWSHVSDQMAAARNYWVGTTRPNGRPHVMPVWGVWIDETFYFGTGNQSRKARNLAQNPAMVVHLESGDNVVILEGNAQRITTMEPQLYERVAADYAAKYAGFRPDPPSESQPFYALRPQVAFGWLEQDFVHSATRWHVPAPYQARAISSHKPSYPDPIGLRRGDVVVVGRLDDAHPGWIWTITADGNAGWTPVAYLEIHGEQATVLQDYDATEMELEPGDRVTVYSTYQGWAWAQHESRRWGWVPLAAIGQD